MKSSNQIAAIFLLLFCLPFYNLQAQNDTLYIMKNGMVAGKYHILTDMDSMILYKPLVHDYEYFTDDRDGKEYKSIAIGEQIWMAENLKYLPEITPAEEGSQTQPGYYIYKYTGTDVAEGEELYNYKTYGVLYNWTAAMGSCPTGWHLPTDEEWTALVDYLGGADVAGGKLKETGTARWNAPNAGATNLSGFTSLPGGGRYLNGKFSVMGNTGLWWSSTESGPYSSWGREMSKADAKVARHYYYDKEVGFSVRCLKD